MARRSAEISRPYEFLADRGQVTEVLMTRCSLVTAIALLAMYTGPSQSWAGGPAANVVVDPEAYSKRVDDDERMGSVLDQLTQANKSVLNDFGIDDEDLKQMETLRRQLLQHNEVDTQDAIKQQMMKDFTDKITEASSSALAVTQRQSNPTQFALLGAVNSYAQQSVLAPVSTLDAAIEEMKVIVGRSVI
jgi:hypothetical protein